jgi:hypothetical protein
MYLRDTNYYFEHTEIISESSKGIIKKKSRKRPEKKNKDNYANYGYQDRLYRSQISSKFSRYEKLDSIGFLKFCDYLR